MTRRRWLLLRGLPLVGLLSLSFVNLYANWVAQAPSDPQPTGDAVIVHAGSGTRISHAFDLMTEGAAPTLVVMFGEENRSLSNDFCGRTEPFEIICPTPDVATTLGEANELRRLAEERGWKTVVTVTSDYHLRRAGYLDRKCGNVDVVRSGAGQALNRSEVVGRIGEEMAGMIQALLARC